MFLVVVLVFFICNALPLVNNIMEAVGGLTYVDLPDELLAVTNLFVTINSSINFLIYCLFGNKFRTIFMQVLRTFTRIATDNNHPLATHSQQIIKSI